MANSGRVLVIGERKQRNCAAPSATCRSRSHGFGDTRYKYIEYKPALYHRSQSPYTKDEAVHDKLPDHTGNYRKLASYGKSFVFYQRCSDSDYTQKLPTRGS